MLESRAVAPERKVFEGFQKQMDVRWVAVPCNQSEGAIVWRSNFAMKRSGRGYNAFGLRSRLAYDSLLAMRAVFSVQQCRTLTVSYGQTLRR